MISYLKHSQTNGANDRENIKAFQQLLNNAYSRIALFEDPTTTPNSLRVEHFWSLFPKGCYPEDFLSYFLSFGEEKKAEVLRTLKLTVVGEDGLIIGRW